MFKNKEKENKVLKIIIAVLIVAHIASTILIIRAFKVYTTDEPYRYGIVSGNVATEEKERKSGLLILPKLKPDGSIKVENYYYSCKEAFLTNEYQLFAEISMSREDYLKEVERLENIKIKYVGNQEEYKDMVNTSYIDEENFNYKAIVTIYSDFGNNYEYALLDENNNRIIYVYLQSVGTNDIKFDKEYLPISKQQDKEPDYAENEEDKDFGYSIYQFRLEGDNGALMPSGTEVEVE